MFVLQTIFEIVLVGFVLWGIFNEDKFVRFEERLVAKLRNKKER